MKFSFLIIPYHSHRVFRNQSTKFSLIVRNLTKRHNEKQLQFGNGLCIRARLFPTSETLIKNESKCGKKKLCQEFRMKKILCKKLSMKRLLYYELPTKRLLYQKLRTKRLLCQKLRTERLQCQELLMKKLLYQELHIGKNTISKIT